MFPLNPLVGCAAIVALLATNVNAHGDVSFFTNSGATYTGPVPLDQAGLVAKGPIRQITTEQPVTENLWGTNSSRLACNQESNILAPSLATVAAGSVLAVQWVNGAQAKEWPHDQGPVMTYMAPCATDNCADDPTTLSFFKIAEDGQVSGIGSQWAQLSIHNGDLWNITVPQNIPSGKYIMRHEIINLINGPGNNEAYPSCFNLEVTGGSSTSTPAEFVQALGESQLAKFPGAYNPSDPTFSTYAVYDDENTEAYVFPGPPVFNVSGGGKNSTTSPSSTIKSSAAPTTTSRAATTTKPPKMSTKMSASHAKTTTAPGGDHPMVFTTVVTQVITLTMTMEMGGAGAGDQTKTHTKTKSSSSPAITTNVTKSSEETTTSTSIATTTSAPAKRHVRRSERWRAIGERS